MNITAFVVLSAILFSIGTIGVLTRRNAIVVFMCVELMLNACNLALVSFAKQRMREYAETGKHVGPLPPPGVFARHNAVDTPALLPDGTAAESSVSRVLAARGTVRSAPAEAHHVDEIEAQLHGDAPGDDLPADEPEGGRA